MNATAPTNRAEKGWGRTLSEINLVNVEETYRKNHVNFNAKQRLEAALSANYLAQKAHRESGRELPDTPGHGSLEEEFLLCLSLCNTVFPAVDDKPRQAPAANPSANAERIAYKSSSPDEEALVEFARFMGYELFQRNPPIISIRITRPAATHTTGSETVPFEQLALCDFTSKRKRMTVVVRAPDGKIRIITKGADNVVSAVLHGADAASASGSFDATLAQYQPNWPETVRQLARFGEQGLRTLVIASAERDASWWDDPVNGMSVKYSAAMRACAVEGPDEIGHFKGACSGQCRRCAIEEQVERAAELKLIGATAIEDKLQDNVADAIKAFTDGGIRVWVLTGDKMETAINIGMACNLLEPSMERRGNLLRIDSETQEGVEQQLDKLIETLSDRTAEQNKDALGLVVTSAAIGRVFRNGEALFPKFWWIASQCKGVICCRMQPNQKARVVALVKASTPAGVTTLAVGDGANDEQMIREADVGVGIRGVEGTSAVRASDYAISQFFFLKRLLFVHGRLSYRRIATLICYIFYKNSLICFTQFWFGIYSGFSGQPIFMEWAYQLYNVMFTAIPILVFAVLDRDISVDLLEKYPKIYRLTSNGQLFNYRIFWRWMVSSLLQSLIIFFFVFAAYDLYSVDGDGQIHDFWTMGLVVYTVTVLVTNIQMALIMTSWTWIHHLAIWGSIFSFYLAMIIFSGSTFWATAGADYYYLQYRLFGTARYWFTVILAVCAALAIDFTIHAWFTLNPPPSKLSAGPPPIAAPKPAITARSPLVTSHVIADSGKSASPASSPSLSSQGAGPEITGKDQQPLWGRPSNVAQSHPSPHHGAPAPSMPTVSEDGPGPDTSLALIFDRGQIPPNTVDLEEKKEDPEAAARSAKEAAEWDPMRHQDTRLSGFSFSHTSGQGQRLGFKF